MDIKVARRTEQIRGNGTTCVYWQAGRCNRNPCRFLHRETPSPPFPYCNAKSAYHYTRKPLSVPENTPKCNSKTLLSKKSGNEISETGNSTKYNSKTVLIRKSGDGARVTRSSKKSSPITCQKSTPIICRYWMNDKCLHGEQCRNLHSWSYGDGFSTLAKLQGHEKAVTGIALPPGSDKLYSGSADGTVRMWDCQTGQCANVINLGSEVDSLITEGPWIFVGLHNAVKAWNIQTASEFTLDGPKGRVLAMNVGNDTLVAGAEDGVISAWRGSSVSEAKFPFELVASLTGHTKAVVCLAVGANRLYSGSMDHSIKVWNLNTLVCEMTLNGHADIVTSLICWDHYLLSSSYDCTINVWAASEDVTLKVIYTHTEENGILALCGMTDAEGKPILYCSGKDNSVRLYELPSFSQRGRLFAEGHVSSIETGPGGLFFTGDRTGSLMVWKWSVLAESKVLASS